MCRCVWSRNLVNEEDSAYWGLSRQKQTPCIRYFKMRMIKLFAQKFFICNSLILFFILKIFAFLQVNFKNGQVFLILPFALSIEGSYSLKEYLIQTYSNHNPVLFTF